MAIPKIIHQTYFKKVNLPRHVEKNIEFLKAKNPGWEYRLYDDNDIVDFIKAHYSPEILRIYNKINPKFGAARADLFRYLLIYKVGGAYFDLKSGANSTLDVLTSGQEYILSHWPGPPLGMFAEGDHVYPRGEYQQWHVIGAPEHPFLKAVIDKVLSNIDNYNEKNFSHSGLKVIRTTGPVPYTQAISPIIKKHPHKLYLSDRDAGLVYSTVAFYPIGTLQFTTHRKILYVDQNKSHYSQIDEPLVFHSEVNHAYQTDSADDMQTDMQLSM